MNRVFKLLLLMIIIIFTVAFTGACHRAEVITISFNSNGGSEVFPVTVTEDSVLPANPTKEGYTFTGWYNDLGFPITAITSSDIFISQTVTAHWTVESYVWSFDAQGGTVDTLSKNVTYDDVIGFLPIPERIGYDFDGWFTEINNGTEITVDNAVNIVGNKIIYAHWIPQVVFIYFNSNGGTFESGNAFRGVDYNSLLGILPNITKEGYMLTGWFSEDVGGTEITSETLINFTESRNYYARWSASNYNISFNYQNATGNNSITTKTVVYNTEYGDLPEPSRDGYSFEGWYTEAEGINRINSNQNVMISLDHTLYAKWLCMFTYIISNNEVTITGYTNKLSNIVIIPETLNGVMVKTIGNMAFFSSTQLQQITIPYGITSIGDNAFKNCINLISITIPESVLTIGEYAFSNCEDLNDAILSQNITYIANGLFSRCSSLGDIIIPGGVINLGDYAFSDCSSLTSIDLGDSMTNIGSNAFLNCENLLKINIPDSVIEISDRAFYQCKKIAELTFGNSVESIGNSAFWNCISITDLSLPSSLNSISDLAFFYCIGIETINIGTSNYFITENNVLYNKDKTILYLYPSNNDNDTFTIPSTLASYKMGALANCFNLVNIFVEENNVNFDSEDGILFNNDKTILYLYPIGRTDESYNVPETVTILWDAAFTSCKLITINLPEGLTDLGVGTFAYCINLENIVIPESAETMGMGMFNSCSKLAVINIPGGIATIGAGTFYDCINLENIILNEGLTSIGEGSFGNCGMLTNFILPSSLITIDIGAFQNCTALTEIIIPDNLTDLNANAFSGCNNLINVTLSENIINIQQQVFQNCIKINDIFIPESISYIAENIFGNDNSLIIYTDAIEKPIGWNDNFNICANDCPLTVYWNTDESNIKYYNGMTYLIIDEEIKITNYYGEENNLSIPVEINGISVSSIGEKAFFSFTTLESIIISDNIIDIASGAFLNCNNLINISLPFVGRNIDAIGNEALFGYIFGNPLFYGYPITYQSYGNLYFAYYIPESLRNVIITGGTALLDGAFSSCRNITDISIPDSITEIGDAAFVDCESIINLTLGNSILHIGNNAFRNCISLTDLIIPDSIIDIGDRVFDGCVLMDNLILGDNLTVIGQNAFTDCVSLTEIIIPDLVTLLPTGIFYNCINLSDITIGSGVIELKEFSFYNCSSLTSLVIPNNVTDIAFNAFSGCSNLIEMSLPFTGINAAASGIEAAFGYIFGFSSYLNSKIIEQKFCSPYVPLSLRKIIITSGSIIKNGAFSGCDILTEIILPDTIITIEESAFYNCTNLVKIETPASVNSIGIGAFNSCTNLISIFIPVSVINVGENVFNNSHSLIIYCEADSLPNGFNTHWNDSNRPVYFSVSEDDIAEISGLHYYKGDAGVTITLYKGNETDIILPVLIEGLNVIEIGDYAFYNTSITSIMIPNSINIIGDYCFLLCNNLITVEFMEGSVPNYIGNSAFKNCTSLINIELPYNSVSNISDMLFYGCSSLEEIIIPYGVQEIKYRAFYNCTSLIDVIISNSVVTIGNEAFKNCSSIEEIVLPESLINMGNNLFSNCISLVYVYVEKAIDYRTVSGYSGTHGSEGMFNGCTSLYAIYVYLENGDAPVYEEPLRDGVLTGVDVYRQHDYWKQYSSKIFANPSGR